MLIYVLQERPDLSMSIRTLSQSMAAPNVGDMRRLKRVVRYVQHTKYMVLRLTTPNTGARQGVLWGMSDSDWAGDRRTRKSTSGGVLFWGGLLVQTFSRAQANVTLSSMEAELVALSTLATEAYGVKHLLEDAIKYDSGVHIGSDSSSAIALSKKLGPGRSRHIEVRFLWVQNAVVSGQLHIFKVGTCENIADPLTKPMVLKGHWLSQMGLIDMNGEHNTEQGGIDYHNMKYEYIDVKTSTEKVGPHTHKSNYVLMVRGGDIHEDTSESEENSMAYYSEHIESATSSEPAVEPAATTTATESAGEPTTSSEAGAAVAAPPTCSQCGDILVCTRCNAQQELTIQRLASVVAHARLNDYNNDSATPRQVRFIFRLGLQLGFTRAELSQLTNLLTRRSSSVVIAHMVSLTREQRSAT
jgi:hypothetical protein